MIGKVITFKDKNGFKSNLIYIEIFFSNEPVYYRIMNKKSAKKLISRNSNYWANCYNDIVIERFIRDKNKYR